MIQSDLYQQKAAMRADLMRRRETIAAAERARAAEAIARTVGAELEDRAAAVIAGFWPLRFEIDPRPTMLRLAGRGHALALPRMQGRGRPLAIHAWAPDDPLIQGRFEVMEPEPSRPLVVPDVVLAPLLAFDRAGGRLGYGAGFYDRTLRALRGSNPALLVIGLAFSRQEVALVPCADYDQRLDAVATEHGLIRMPAAPPA